GCRGPRPAPWRSWVLLAKAWPSCPRPRLGGRPGVEPALQAGQRRVGEVAFQVAPGARHEGLVLRPAQKRLARKDAAQDAGGVGSRQRAVVRQEDLAIKTWPGRE